MQQKIIVMTQLALYDKHEGHADQLANDYFRHDYIYRKNLGTRFAVGFGGFIMLGLYWARNIFIDGADLFELDFTTHLYDSILFILAILAVYSLIGTIQGTREYYLVQKRLTRYHALVRQLERINDQSQRTAREKAVEEEEAKTAETKPTRPSRPRRTIGEAEEELSQTRRVEPIEDHRLHTSPLIYRNPFPPIKTTPQRSADETHGTDTDNTGTHRQDV
ncbi:MAG: hypothetical protein FWD90_11275 [Defluviitaleaceae bacterium]|nr:hypothetical protein [Defluviitaleaceae bacterium]